jgi:hypothetical protein
MRGAVPPLPQYVFMAWRLVKHRDFTFLCMYVCMYVITYVYVYVITYVCIYVCMHVCMHACHLITFRDISLNDTVLAPN